MLLFSLNHAAFSTHLSFSHSVSHTLVHDRLTGILCAKVSLMVKYRLVCATLCFLLLLFWTLKSVILLWFKKNCFTP